MRGGGTQVHSPARSVEVGVVACALALVTVTALVSATQPDDAAFHVGPAAPLAVGGAVATAVAVVAGLLLKRRGWALLGLDPAQLPPHPVTEAGPVPRGIAGAIGLALGATVLLVGAVGLTETHGSGRRGWQVGSITVLVLALGVVAVAGGTWLLARAAFGCNVPPDPGRAGAGLGPGGEHVVHGRSDDDHDRLPREPPVPTRHEHAGLPLVPPMAPVLVPVTDVTVPGALVVEIDGAEIDTPYAALRAILVQLETSRSGLGGFTDVTAAARELGRPVHVVWRDAAWSRARMGDAAYELAVRELHAAASARHDASVPSVTYHLD